MDWRNVPQTTYSQQVKADSLRQTWKNDERAQALLNLVQFYLSQS